MSYQTLYQQRQAFTGTDAEFIVHANEVIDTRKPLGQAANFVSLRTVRFLFGAAVAAAVDAALAGDATAQILFRQADGVDAALDEVQGMIAAFTGTVLTAEQAAVLKAYGVNSAKRCAAWGFAEVTEADLTEAARVEAWRVLRNAVQNELIAPMDTLFNNATGAAPATVADMLATLGY